MLLASAIDLIIEIPTLLTFIGIVLIGYGLWRKKRLVTRAGYGTFIGAAFIAIPLLLMQPEGVEMSRAYMSFGLLVGLAIMAMAMLAFKRTKRVFFTGFVLIYAVVVPGVLALLGNSGAPTDNDLQADNSDRIEQTE